MTIRSFEGKTPNIHPTAYVDETALVIGDVTIGAHTSIWPMCVLRGDVHSISIGERSNIQDGTIVHVTHDGEYSPGGSPTYIGNDVTVGHAAIIHACTLEDECLIGMNTTVLDRAVVKKHVMVGAGSVVGPGKELESGFLYVGSPTKQVRPLTEKQVSYFIYSAKNYVDLAARHAQS